MKMTRLFPALFGFTLVLAIAAGCRTAHPGKMSVNVRDLGAKGDGMAKDTAAFQAALDACATRGGGIVTVPAGNYLIGSVVVGANTTLQLERGAKLTGSPDIADYPLINVRWEGEFRRGASRADFLRQRRQCHHHRRRRSSGRHFRLSNCAIRAARCSSNWPTAPT